MSDAETIWQLRFLHPRFWPTWIVLGLMRATSLLPLRVTWLLGQGLGLLVYALHAPRRHIVTRNIERCFPELAPRARGRLVRAHFRAFGQAALENGVAWWGSARRLRRRTRIVGRKYLDDAIAARRNVILLAAHFVGLEIAGMRLSLEWPVLGVFRHPADQLLRAAMWRGRVRFGATLVRHDQPLLSLVRALKSGKPLYYLPDQNAPRHLGVFAPFFGIPASTFTAPARLARLADAVVIPCIARQLPRGRGHEIVLLPPLENYPTGDDVADATRTNAVIEEAVRRWPEQYFWVHMRFRIRPKKGEPKFYRKK
jgi:KDO2-lipid IV(A) lauroyltransferase